MLCPEVLSICTLLISFCVILVAVKYFGKNGLYVYTSVVTIAANIQVLKLTKYTFVDHPIALGTVLFATVFAVDNILTEYYGVNTAKKNVWLSFLGYVFFTLVMRIAVMHPAVESADCVNLYIELQRLFSPSFVLLISSLVSYAISQLADIGIFAALKKITRGKCVSIRAFVSMAISTFIDNCVFSVCAWVIFADAPVGWNTLWFTYIFITYLLRLLIAVLCVPLVRLSGILIGRKGINVQEF